MIITNTSGSVQNTYIGGSGQQATSVVTETDQNCYEKDAGCFSVYGFEVRVYIRITVPHVNEVLV